MLLIAAPAKASKLESWKFNSRQNQLEFSTNEGVQPQAQLVTDPTRLVIDLPGVVLGRPAINETYDGLIRSIRIGQFDRATTRLVIEIAPGYTIDPNQIKFRGISDQQWLVTLPRPQSAPNDATTRAAPGSTATNSSSSPNSSSLVVVQTQRLKLRTTTPAVSMSNSPAPSSLQTPNGRVLVLIDPGHGGPDPGAIGIGGLQEKGVVLDIGTRVATLLQQRGIQAYMTRNDDRDLDLEPRVQMAEQSNATVFVSIHANAIDLSRPEVSGLETYYFQSGADLARIIHQSILQTTGVTDRGVRTARFYVLRKTSMPSVLVEVGFVTGRDDAARLANASYRAQMADAIARGILQYLQRSAKL